MKSKNTHTKTILNIRLDILICLFLASVTLAVYWQVINYAFVFDDAVYVAENFHVRRGLTSETVVWAFTTTSIANWHPLTWLSHMLDIQLYGMNPGNHHLTNVLFHIANTLLLFLILTRATGALWQSALVVALFALHPLHVESVAWISERKDVLSTFFWMLTIGGYIRYVERPGVKRYLLILLFFILGLMVKPMLVTLPFVLLLMDYWPLCRFQFSRSGGANPDSQLKSFSLFLVWEKIPLIVLTAVFSVVAFLVQRSGGAVGSLEIFPLHYRIMNALVSYVSYIGKMIWPFHLAFLYPYPGKLPWWHVSGAFLLLLSISLLSIRNVRRFPWFAVGWLWYLGTLVPVIGLVQIGSQAMADRYTYVPLIGLFIMIAWGIPEIFKRWHYKREGLVAITAALLSFFTVTTWFQVRYWENSISLYEHALDITAGNYLAHNNLGVVLQKQGRLTEAIEHYSEALRIWSDYADAHNNLGFALAEKGRTAEAIDHYFEALRINPLCAKIYNNLGNVLMGEGKTEEAIRHYSEALRIDSYFSIAHNNLGIALFGQGKLDGAINHYMEALRIYPGYAEAHNNLGAALAKQGRTAEAIVHFSEALQIKPDFAVAQNNIQELSSARDKIDIAVKETLEALRINPKDTSLHFKLGNLYEQKGELDKAIDCYEKVLLIQPGSVPALTGLAIAYAVKGKFDKAFSSLKKTIRLQPDNADAYYFISGIHARQENVEDSIHWLKIAVEKGFDNWDLLKTDKNFINIRGSLYYKKIISFH
ncbi:hypothetical protein C6A37_02215 [Desulfobacteraceae bacterium SEEP-SAG9]|nr:hypothetical protein C6A37_02215 [Desulfobacteraceae bacterium SEEP-SAG9]